MFGSLPFSERGQSKRGTPAYFVTVVKVIEGEKLILGDFQKYSDSVKGVRQKKTKTELN